MEKSLLPSLRFTVKYLGNNKIGDKGAEYIAQGHWEELNELHLGLNNIGDKGYSALTKGFLKNLKKIDL